MAIYQQQIIQQLESYMEEQLIEYKKISFEDSFFYPFSFKEFATTKDLQVKIFNMEEKKTASRISFLLSEFLENKQSKRPLLLILFLDQQPSQQRIYEIDHAYNLYRLVKEQLLSDWAIVSLDGQDFIIADEGERCYLLAEETYKQHVISIRVKPNFPPHKTLN
ncbi:MAG: hypothetical protein ACK5MJ_00250 [Alphaproteobacteria bacterium]